MAPANSRDDLVGGYQALRDKAKNLFDILARLQTQQSQIFTPQEGLSSRIQAVLRGQVLSGVVPARPTDDVRLVARAMQANPAKAIDIAIADLEDVLDYIRERCPYPNNDHNREILVKRKHQLQAFLPASLHPPADLALTHIEHEALHRTYTNSTTLILSEPLSTIPRSAFYVTEDNYAWDLSELAQAIAANGGVMRNPLSREIFTPGDVRGILAHPLGKVLAPLHAEQQSMAQGVRPETVERLEHLGLVMLGENARDQLGSRMEIDGFQAYVATLPDRKQKTIEEFRCPAVDKHSRVAFDSTVGQTLQDAKATELCIHKAGDFVVQAASFLKRAQEEGAVDDEKMENGCVIM